MKEVLYIGPDHRGHRGGIGAVLDTYSANISPFKFIPTYNNTPPFSRNILFLKAIFRLFRILIADRDIRIVHIHTAQKGSFIRKSIMLLISKLLGRKVVLHLHASMFDLYYNKAGILRPYIRFIFRRADAVICLSDKWKDFYSTHFKIKKLFILNNVIERPLIAHAAGEGEGPVKLLFLGLIGQRKGLFDLLEVLQRNRDNFRDKYTLTIGGNGEVKRLEETLKNNHQGDPIRFAGWVVGEEKNKLLRDCDIYILPSHNEGLPISILEAMAYRKPIISTTVGGIPEIVKPGYNGWLFAPGDGKGLQQVLEEALNNKSLLKTYGLNSYALTADYTPEAVMRSLAILYDEVLD